MRALFVFVDLCVQLTLSCVFNPHHPVDLLRCKVMSYVTIERTMFYPTLVCFDMVNLWHGVLLVTQAFYQASSTTTIQPELKCGIRLKIRDLMSSLVLYVFLLCV